MSSKSLKNAAVLLVLEEFMLRTVVALSLVVVFLTSNESGTHRQRKSRKYNMLNQILAQVDSNAHLMHDVPDVAHNDESNKTDDVDEDENPSVCQPGSQREKRKKTRGKKRKSIDVGTSTQLIELLSAFMQSTEEKLGQIAQLIGYEQDAAIRRKELFAQVDKIEGLSMMDKLKVSDELSLCPHKLDMFQGLPETERKDYAQMLLAKLL